jgi:transcriptional regulator with XRE-family HTH domain
VRKTVLKEKRDNKRITMKQVSERAGISESYYCLIENGERKPSVDVAKRIAGVLGFEWTMFFENEKVSGQSDEGGQAGEA